MRVCSQDTLHSTTSKIVADTYYTLSAESTGLVREKMSRFLSFAYPVASADEAKQRISAIANKYHDARHVCWAYMIGSARTEYQSSDNGEPSGTAGKPILGQINSFNLTNIVIVVVRYFGGIKLGTSGLIVAYREAAREAIEAGTIIECHDIATVTFQFPYLSMNDVMRVAKDKEVKVVEQSFDNSCSMTLSTRADNMDALRQRLADIDGVSII
ncbi:MAG: YigZ family protein [Muribaculaceae bacterium]|nr:YigZ family protein [Muribaculaceae bacterium]MDE6320793.1 YigZ family protein [Muribaculaceae bacterium]